MDPTNILIKILVYAFPVIFAITLHEAAHGYVARHFGDSTAYMLGRVSLNPVRHIDPIGTIVLPIVTLLLSGFMFGWAKPVPVNFQNLRHPKRDSLWVAAAGPASNLAQALIWAAVARVLAEVISPTGLAGGFWLAVAEAGVVVNVAFAILNLVPLLPLDGGRMLASILPGRLSYQYSRLEPYGMIILILLIVTPVLGRVLNPLVLGTLRAIYSLFGLQ
ncbi:MAG TPA: site-2 protease family protein [Usitatibacter sp.]|jgi:Zn-dependent protease|nr:site-2 protease family protein [Usitatibacter sp.]